MWAAFLRSFHNYWFPLQKGGRQLGSTCLCSTVWVQVAESRNDHTYISSAVSAWRWTHGGASFLRCFPLTVQEDDAGSKTAHCQVKMTQFCFRSCLYFISFLSEHLINKSKWTITSSKQACSEIPETIKRWGKQFIASYAWILGILDISGNTSLYSLKLV